MFFRAIILSKIALNCLNVYILYCSRYNSPVITSRIWQMNQLIVKYYNFKSFQWIFVAFASFHHPPFPFKIIRMYTMCSVPHINTVYRFEYIDFIQTLAKCICFAQSVSVDYDESIFFFFFSKIEICLWYYTQWTIVG